MKPSLEMRSHSYKSLGYCIFCLDKQLPPKPLTDEHIVPLALNGTLLFRRATCDPCARFGNKSYENPAHQADLLVPRIMLALNRRRKKTKGAKRLPSLGRPGIDISQIGHEGFDVDVPINEYPPVAVLPTFARPGLLSGENSAGTLKAVGAHILILRACTPEYAGAERVITNTPSQPYEFGLYIAKIAYCYAVAERGIGSFNGTNLRANLMGDRADLFLYVGASRLKQTREKDHLHWLDIRIERGLMVVSVQLFSSFAGPIFDVIVGPSLL